MDYLKHMASEFSRLLEELERVRLSFQVLELAMQSDCRRMENFVSSRRAYREVLDAGLAQLDQCRVDLGIFCKCLSAGKTFSPD